jgi:hypothetical protein
VAAVPIASQTKLEKNATGYRNIILPPPLPSNEKFWYIPQNMN